MCIYHGWKFDVNGTCVDMPSDLPGSTCKDKIRATAYSTVESAGVIWAYIGPSEKQPLPPNFIFNTLPPEQVVAFGVPIYCNYLQSMEGNIDSTHLGTLHVMHQDKIPVDLETDKPGYPSPKFSLYTRAKYRYARVDVQDTTYGFRLLAARPTDPDDPTKRLKRMDNDYMLDRWAQKHTILAGIWPIPEQDYALTETMGPIYDRTTEHLYAADAAIIRVRQMLATMARNLREGIEPPALDPNIPFQKIRAEEIIVGPGDDPWLVAVHAGENAERGERLI